MTFPISAVAWLAVFDPYSLPQFLERLAPCPLRFPGGSRQGNKVEVNKSPPTRNNTRAGLSLGRWGLSRLGLHGFRLGLGY